MTDTEKLIALRAAVVSLFAGMDEMSEALHPWVVEDAWRMAELLEIDPHTVPTERRALTLGQETKELPVRLRAVGGVAELALGDKRVFSTTSHTFVDTGITK